MSEDRNLLPPPAALRLEWDVFLSFRGEDTRRTITTNLYNSLRENGVRVFLDDVGITQGDKIAPSLMEAIEDSAAAIIVISRRYADSHWCLEKLTRICELKRLILPVFYGVEPSDVRRQKGPFQQDFLKHSQRFGEDKVSKWREAMTKVGDTSGFVFDGSQEQQLIWRLVNRVQTQLRKTPVGIIPTYTVGLDSRVEKLTTLLDVKSNRIQVLGLYGMGGIGKTTLAAALFNKLVAHFECRSFISNVKQVAKEDDGLLSLQNKLLCDLSHNNVPPIDDVDAGILKIKEKVNEKRVLIVLDDVDDVIQLNALAGKRDWFAQGSRIIITTRDTDVLVEHLVNELYEVRELHSDEALQLFSYHALRRETPLGEYLNLSKQIVAITGKLPLALEVFGSSLFHERGIEKWKIALKKLQEIRPHDLQGVLRISFDGLDEDVKCAFLDIACLFIEIGMKREEAIEILKGCGFSAETVITVLTAKSLIKIHGDYTLWMHDQLRDMGRQIVRDENIVSPGMRSRLWDRYETITLLKNKQGTEHVEGIILDLRKKNIAEDPSAVSICWDNVVRTPNISNAFAYLKELCKTWIQHGAENDGKVVLTTTAFKPMVNLRLLQINHARLEGKFKIFPAGVKWLRWKGCPLKSLPSDYHPGQLAVLDLSESGIEQVWGGGRNKVAENLMVMNLHHCYNLVAVPDLSGYKTLEKIDLEHCIKLTKIHKSVGNVMTLLHLNLKDCSNLVEFPSDVSGLKLLQNLILSDCNKLKELPENIGSMCSLKELIVDRTVVTSLPESIYRLTKLEKLSLNGCQFLKKLPQCLGNLISLKELYLNHSGIEQIPDSVGSLSNIEKLSLMRCRSLNAIPESVGNLQSLTNFFVNNSSITELPASIGSLSYLKELSAGGCSSLSKLPDSIGGLVSVSILELDGTSITDLPDQIRGLKMIDKLHIRNCMSLESLPEAIGSMLTLTSLNLFGANINELPESIEMLENLVMLNLSECEKLHKLPASIGNLKALYQLLMEKTAVRELPESFGMLSSLKVLRMGNKPLQSPNVRKTSKFVLPISFSNLSLLVELNARAWRISGKIPDDFERLSLLKILDLGYNNFWSLPSSLRGLSLLRELHLPYCEDLKSLPPLPLSLEKVDVSNCFALESISDVSNLELLELLNLTNCEKVVDIPGLECLKSLTRLYMSGCRACSIAVKRRLSKTCLRNMRNLSMPGSEIPDWFTQEVVSFSGCKNREIKAVIIAVVVNIDCEMAEDFRVEPKVVPDIQVHMLNLNKTLYSNTLYLLGVPKAHEDQLHLCRFPHWHPLVSGLKDGYKIEVRKRNPPVIEGVKLKKCGIQLVFENDDDYDGNEDSLVENQQSVSHKLAYFFSSVEEVGQA